MIFVDSNIPMYLVGAPHDLKWQVQQRLEQFIAAGERLVTSVEVFQDLLHHYLGIGRSDAIQPAFDALAGIVDEVFSIARADIDRARAGAGLPDTLGVRCAACRCHGARKGHAHSVSTPGSTSCLNASGSWPPIDSAFRTEPTTRHRRCTQVVAPAFTR